MSQDNNNEYGVPDADEYAGETHRTRTVDAKPGWGLYVNVDDANEWFTMMAKLGLLKSPSQLDQLDLIGKYFNSLEDADTFFTIYSRAIGFPVRKGHKRKNTQGIVKNREWLCAKEGHRDQKYFNLDNRRKEPKSLTREGCTVRFRVNLFPNTDKWIVREFVVHHSHDLAKATHIQFMPSNREVSGGAVRTAKAMKTAGMKTCVIMSFFAHQVGGYDNLRFTKKDLYNRLSRTQLCELSDSDAAQAIGYLQYKCDQDLGFFGKYTYDSESRLENMLWADGKSRRDFGTFGDVLSFDTTYKTNQYGKPLLVFVGVNNHFRTTIFGFALLKNENMETYIWALRTFVECMNDQTPKTVITDGDLVMKSAIAEVMPSMVHRLCSWHLEQNCLVHIKKQGFLMTFKKLLFRFYSSEQFEVEWKKTIDDFGLHGNAWVDSVYDKRHSWADSFLRGSFFGGMSTTQRCEKMHSFLKSNLNERITLIEFVRGMDSALSYLRHKESEDEYITSSTKPVLAQTNMPKIEEEAASIYTRRMFFRVRDEMKKEGKYVAYALEETPEVIKCSLQKYGSIGKSRQIIINKHHMEFKCGCNTLSSKGIPCRHIFAAMKTIHLTSFPKSVVLKRWTVLARLDDIYLGEKAGPWTNILNDEKARFGHITSKCSEIAFLDSRDDKIFYKAIEEIDKLTSVLKPLFTPTTTMGCAPTYEDSESQIPIKNPLNSTTKGGWSGTKRSENGKRHCTICHMAGHNKATCHAHTRTSDPARESEDEVEINPGTSAFEAGVSPGYDRSTRFVNGEMSTTQESHQVVDLGQDRPFTQPDCTNDQ